MPLRQTEIVQKHRDKQLILTFDEYLQIAFSANVVT